MKKIYKKSLLIVLVVCPKMTIFAAAASNYRDMSSIEFDTFSKEEKNHYVDYLITQAGGDVCKAYENAQRNNLEWAFYPLIFRCTDDLVVQAGGDENLAYANAMNEGRLRDSYMLMARLEEKENNELNKKMEKEVHTSNQMVAVPHVIGNVNDDYELALRLFHEEQALKLVNEKEEMRDFEQAMRESVIQFVRDQELKEKQIDEYGQVNNECNIKGKGKEPAYAPPVVLVSKKREKRERGEGVAGPASESMEDRVLIENPIRSAEEQQRDLEEAIALSLEEN